MSRYSADDFVWIEPRKTNGLNLVRAREAAGLSRQELAQCVGVQQRQVQRWEQEASKPSPASLYKLDKLFGENWSKTK